MQMNMFSADDWVDPGTGKKVPYVGSSGFKAEIAILKEWAPNKRVIFSVDVETTQLSQTSAELNLTSQQKKSGANPKPRCRTAQIGIYFESDTPVHEVLFDLDELTEEERADLASVVLSANFLAHNATFDLNWLRWQEKLLGKEPTDSPLVLDSMLLTRLVCPDLLIEAAQCRSKDNRYEDGTFYEPKKAAFVYDLLIQGRSGTSLADASYLLFGEELPKDFQKPQNWMEPYLTQGHYDYGLMDTRSAIKILRELIIRASMKPGVPKEVAKLPLMDAYNILRECEGYQGEVGINLFQLLELQSLVYPKISNQGMPVSAANTKVFQAEQTRVVEEMVEELVTKYPALQKHSAILKDMDKGLTKEARQDIAEVLIELGVPVGNSAKSETPQVGEKDLRKVGCENIAPEFFKLLIGSQKAKKMSQMAGTVLEFAQRARDGRLHPLFGITTNTGRLAVSEPNTQQFPGKQSFRNLTERTATFKVRKGTEAVVSALLKGQKPSIDGYFKVPVSDFETLNIKSFIQGEVKYSKIVSVDFSALDMRIGAACALRAQKKMDQIAANPYGKYEFMPELVEILQNCYFETNLDELKKLEMEGKANRAKIKEKLVTMRSKIQEIGNRKPTDKDYDLFKAYGSLNFSGQLAALQQRLAQVRQKAITQGVDYWGSLQEAFKIPGMDIHSWTALGMLGRDPVQEFKGLSNEETAVKLKKVKEELGDKRKTGKVANLALLYAMQTFGFVESTAKSWNIHWTFEEADQIRINWLDTYPEVDLWHIWTSIDITGRAYLPQVERGGKESNQKYWICKTLAGREILATGLNAALSYEDQSTGADILGLSLTKLYKERRDVFDCLINQVHDEVVAEFPEEKAQEYTEVLAKYLVDAAHVFTGWNPETQQGVQVEVGPAIGDVWLKD